MKNDLDMEAMKFNLGDTIYWVESSCNYRKQVPCPMCFGKCFVTIVLGDGSQTQTSCGFCDHGYEGPRGTATVWEPHARVESGVITGVSTKNGPRYEVGSHTVEESAAFSTKETAELERERQYSLEVDRAKKWFEDSFVNCKKKQVWSAGYHKNCIASAERTISWHKLRLGMIEEKIK